MVINTLYFVIVMIKNAALFPGSDILVQEVGFAIKNCNSKACGCEILYVYKRTPGHFCGGWKRSLSFS